MNFTELEEEYKYEKFVRWFKKLCVFVFIIALPIVGFVWYVDCKSKINMQKDRDIGDHLVQILQKKEAVILDKKLNSTRPSDDLLQLANIYDLIHKGNISETLQTAEALITSAKSETTSGIAKIIWMTLVLNNSLYNENNKLLFLKYVDSFAQKNVFFDKANVLAGLFYIQQNNPEKAKIVLLKVLSLKNVAPLVLEEAKAVLASI